MKASSTKAAATEQQRRYQKRATRVSDLPFRARARQPYQIGLEAEEESRGNLDPFSLLDSAPAAANSASFQAAPRPNEKDSGPSPLLALDACESAALRGLAQSKGRRGRHSGGEAGPTQPISRRRLLFVEFAPSCTVDFQWRTRLFHPILFYLFMIFFILFLLSRSSRSEQTSLGDRSPEVETLAELDVERPGVLALVLALSIDPACRCERRRQEGLVTFLSRRFLGLTLRESRTGSFGVSPSGARLRV